MNTTVPLLSRTVVQTAYLDTTAVLGVMVEILEDVPSVQQAFARTRDAGDSWDGQDPIRPSAAKR